MPVEILHPPVTYSPWVVTVGWSLVALGTLVIPGALWATSTDRWRRWARAQQERSAARKALTRIGRIEKAVQRGAASPADAASQLSRVVRGFAAERTGIAYDRMTLERMRAITAPAALAEAVKGLYASAFGVEASVGDVVDGAREARRVVTSWTTL